MPPKVKRKDKDDKRKRTKTKKSKRDKHKDDKRKRTKTKKSKRDKKRKDKRKPLTLIQRLRLQRSQLGVPGFKKLTTPAQITYDFPTGMIDRVLGLQRTRAMIRSDNNTLFQDSPNVPSRPQGTSRRPRGRAVIVEPVPVTEPDTEPGAYSRTTEQDFPPMVQPSRPPIRPTRPTRPTRTRPQEIIEAQVTLPPQQAMIIPPTSIEELQRRYTRAMNHLSSDNFNDAHDLPFSKIMGEEAPDVQTMKRQIKDTYDTYPQAFTETPDFPWVGQVPLRGDAERLRMWGHTEKTHFTPGFSKYYDN